MATNANHVAFAVRFSSAPVPVPCKRPSSGPTQIPGRARNPSAAGEIRGNLILGLVLIESLVIYVLLIALILFFVVPF